MSRYKQFLVDKIEDYSLFDRPSKVSNADFAHPVVADRLTGFLDSLPNILAASDLRDLISRIHLAQAAGVGILWGFGGHVIKVGLAPLLVDLMKSGYITALATNGSGMIHDFEIAVCGNTSEDVSAVLQDGAFGMARETGEMLNEAVRRAAEQKKGLGESVGEMLDGLDPEFSESSVFLQAFRLGIPVTVHVAYGTDIVHNHPSADGGSWGAAVQTDFQIFTHQVSTLSGGGVYLNVGSAVVLPEVFLKGVSLVYNSGQPIRDLNTANFDFIQHYRPTQNVVRRPVSGTGRGFAFTGHHELMIPLLAALLRLAAPQRDEQLDKRT